MKAIKLSYNITEEPTDVYTYFLHHIFVQVIKTIIIETISITRGKKLD